MHFCQLLIQPLPYPTNYISTNQAPSTEQHDFYFMHAITQHRFSTSLAWLR